MLDTDKMTMKNCTMFAMLGQMYTNGGFSKIMPKINAGFSFNFLISCKIAYLFA